MIRFPVLCAILLLTLEPKALPPDFERKDWITGLVSPLAMKWAPDGRLFVLEQAGHVRIVKDGALLPAKFATVKAWMGHRESMLGVAFDPAFADNGYLYLYYSENGAQKNRITRITSSKDNPDLAEPGSEVILLDGIGTASYQGGAFFFGKDRMLYAASAHGGSQDLNDLGGKILRLNPAAYPNVIPADNPFVGRAGARPEVWAYGLREPFTGAADTVTGDMVVNDVGDGRAEEVNLVKKGANYGYEAGCEGTCAKAGMENPWIEYSHAVGSCITGGAFYYGGSFPREYRGSYFYADWGMAWIKRRDATGKIVDFDAGGKVIQLDVGPDGSLYLLKIVGENIAWTGSVQRVRYTGALGTAPYAVGKEVGRFGPEVNTVRKGSRDGIRFFLGGDGPWTASLEIRDGRGRAIASLASTAAQSDLVWTFGPGEVSTGIRYYTLKTLASTGTTGIRSGRILFLD